MQLGRINRLTINRITPPGAYLEDILENEVLLPKKYLLPENEIGTEVDVFVHKDSENRIVATTETPFILLGDFRYLTVIHVNPYGAFVDWGLDKDLLVPFSEQRMKMEAGRFYVVFVYLDEKTGRIAASNKWNRFIIDIFKFYNKNFINKILSSSENIFSCIILLSITNIFIFLILKIL